MDELKKLYEETQALRQGLCTIVDPLINAVNDIGATLNKIEDQLTLITMKIEQEARDQNVDLHPVDLTQVQDTSITIGVAPRNISL